MKPSFMQGAEAPNVGLPMKNSFFRTLLMVEMAVNSLGEISISAEVLVQLSGLDHLLSAAL